MADIFIGISNANIRIEASIRKHGAIPVLFDDYIAHDLDALDGIIITGNKYDVPPALYGHSAHKETLVAEDNKRLDFEIGLIKHSYHHNLPLLAICGGLQLLNVAFGGTLIQHLPDYSDNSVNHRQTPGTYHEPAHKVNIVAESLLHHISGAQSSSINSDHHQAVGKIGAGFRVNAHAPDGTIEGIEHTAHPFLLGVQWHPEYYSSAIDAPIFNAFTDASALRNITARRMVG